MAEDEDGVADRKSASKSTNEGLSEENDQNAAKPDLGIEEAKYNNVDNEPDSTTESTSSSSKASGAIRKEDNPFSFRHFLKRDLSLPGNSTYENTGARPKVYANTVQHSPNKSEFNIEPRREKARSTDPQAKDTSRENSTHRLSDNTTSSSSVEIPFNAVKDSESKSNLYINLSTENSEGQFYHRPNIASEPLGMPSLPDFVQDHILVEQAYLNSNGPISVDLDNLPDFTFNTNYNTNSSWNRRNNSSFSGNRNYDYDRYMASTSEDVGTCDRNVPLDLPVGAEAACPLPLDLPPHINLDLTESVNPADRRNNSPRSTFPLDLPPNAGAESMRLPDFLPVHPGRTSPEPEHQDEQLQQILSELERTRSELLTERARRSRLESELTSARLSISVLETESRRSREQEAALRARLEDSRQGERRFTGQLGAAAQAAEDTLLDTASRATEAESTVSKLRNQIKKLKEELSASQAEVRSLRSTQTMASRDLRQATGLAETSLRELLAGLDQLKSLSASLEPT